MTRACLILVFKNRKKKAWEICDMCEYTLIYLKGFHFMFKR